LDVSFGVSGARTVSAVGRGALWLWDVRAAGCTRVAMPRGAALTCASFSGAGFAVGVGTASGAMVYDLRMNQLLTEFARPGDR
jgi:hypothetical protein